MTTVAREAKLRCPKCRGGSVPFASAPTTEVRCGGCGAVFPVRDGVVDLLDGPDAPRTPSQRLMESESVVRIYESRLWRRSAVAARLLGLAFEAEQEEIVRALALGGDEAVLDVACGPGIYSRLLSRRVHRGRVVGLDVSRPMLRQARRRASGEGGANLSFVRASALDLPSADAAFDAVNCCGALHLFPDPGRALAEMSRVLVPGGRLALAVAREPARRYAASAARALGVQSLSKSRLESMLATAGLRPPTMLHEGGVWMIASSGKPSVKA